VHYKGKSSFAWKKHEREQLKGGLMGYGGQFACSKKPMYVFWRLTCTRGK